MISDDVMLSLFVICHCTSIVIILIVIIITTNIFTCSSS